MTGLSLARRHVVLLPFPFSDLSAQKLRPALVLADAGRGDWPLCQITSYAGPAKGFTAHASLIKSTAGEPSPGAHQRVCDALVELLTTGAA